jgi:predicted MFS family arabinose efflux permease
VEFFLLSGVWHPVPVTDQKVRRRKRSFGYDMGVNVLANLVAAAVVYLGAVYGGYLVENRDIMAVSIAVIMGALVGVTASLLSRLTEREATRHQPSDNLPTR